MFKDLYIDDINTSVDSETELHKLKRDITKIMTEHGFPLKGFAISNSKPDESLSENDFTMIAGWKWYSESDTMQLAIPPIFIGEKKKGLFSKNTKFLHDNPTRQEIVEFYKDQNITLPHIVSRTAMLFDMAGFSTPLAILGNYVARLALEYIKGNQQKAVSDHIREAFLTYLYLASEFATLPFKYCLTLKRMD